MAAYDDDPIDVSIKMFNSKEDDFETWVKLFEKSVNLSATDRNENNLHYLYKEWLPLKLDDAARAHLGNASSDDWPALKEELADLLIDPLERAKWEAKTFPIQWDGKETVQSLANRVKRKVDKFEKRMPQIVKDRDYFERFVMAFEKPIRRFIHENCALDQRTINNAKEIVTRYLLANRDDRERSCPSMTAAAALLPRDNAAIQSQLNKISTKIDNLSLTFKLENKKIRSQIRALDKRVRMLEEKAHRNEQPSDSDDHRDSCREDDHASQESSSDDRPSDESSDDDH